MTECAGPAALLPPDMVALHGWDPGHQVRAWCSQLPSFGTCEVTLTLWLQMEEDKQVFQGKALKPSAKPGRPPCLPF